MSSYIQSGSVLFNHVGDYRKTLRKKIAASIKKKFDVNVHITIKTLQEFDRLIRGRPFDKENLYVTFLFNTPSSVNMEILDYAKKGLDKI